LIGSTSTRMPRSMSRLRLGWGMAGSIGEVPSDTRYRSPGLVLKTVS
jgi:hypothetical protein